MYRNFPMSLGLLVLLSALAGCARSVPPAAAPTASHPIVDFAVGADDQVRRAAPPRAERTVSLPPMRIDLWTAPIREMPPRPTALDGRAHDRRAHRVAR